MLRGVMTPWHEEWNQPDFHGVSGSLRLFWQILNECLSYLAVHYHLIVEFCSQLVHFLGSWWLWTSVCGEKGAETEHCNLKS